MTKGAAAMEHDYEVLDRDSGNLVATFPSEQTTRAAVRTAIQQDGAASVASWLVGRIDHEGPVLQGRELLTWAQASEAPLERPPGEAVVRARDAVGGQELVAVVRRWLEKRASPAQRRELTPMVDAFEALSNVAIPLIAEAKALGARSAATGSAQDANQARDLLAAMERIRATMERTLRDLERQRLAIRDWFASQRLAQTEEEAAIDEAVRTIDAYRFSEAA